MKRERKINLSKVRRDRAALIRWQKKTGITLVEMRPTEKPRVWQYNLSPLRKMADDVLALIATGMSGEDAAKIVTDKVKKEAALKRAPQ